MVGASGAIAGVLGAYLVLYPRAPIYVVNPVLPLWFVFGVFLVFPAWLVVGEWFLVERVQRRRLHRRNSGGGAVWRSSLTSAASCSGCSRSAAAMIGRTQRTAPRQWHGWRPPLGRLPAGQYRGGPSPRTHGVW